jgi:hypothetical protein
MTGIAALTGALLGVGFWMFVFFGGYWYQLRLLNKQK